MGEVAIAVPLTHAAKSYDTFGCPNVDKRWYRIEGTDLLTSVTGTPAQHKAAQKSHVYRCMVGSEAYKTLMAAGYIGFKKGFHESFYANIESNLHAALAAGWTPEDWRAIDPSVVESVLLDREGAQ